jgi:hypothetical protein
MLSTSHLLLIQNIVILAFNKLQYSFGILQIVCRRKLFSQMRQLYNVSVINIYQQL